jgi:hypothetical protein
MGDFHVWQINVYTINSDTLSIIDGGIEWKSVIIIITSTDNRCRPEYTIKCMHMDSQRQTDDKWVLSTRFHDTVH